MVNAGQRHFDPGQNAAKRGPTAVPNAVNRVKAVVTSSLASSGWEADPDRQTGPRVRLRADVTHDVKMTGQARAQ